MTGRVSSLAELASATGARLAGDGTVTIRRVRALEDAGEGDVTFLANERYRQHLASTKASAVILGEDDLDACTTNALVSANPYLCYARVSALLHPQPRAVPGCHPSAVTHPSATIHPAAEIGPLCVIGENAEIGAGVVVGAGSVVQSRVRIGAGSRLVARVTLCEGVRIGERCLIHPGVVIGADGFGLANDGGTWVKVPQLGAVIIGNDVEIGANTTIDRGSLRDTVIGDGVKMDNLIQVAHNVSIGSHSAIAACSGIAGSTSIGRHCTLAGNTGIAGHLEIADGVHFSGMSLVTRSHPKAGSYSGNLPAMPTRAWRRAIGRIRHLDALFQRVKRLEAALRLDPRAQETADE